MQDTLDLIIAEMRLIFGDDRKRIDHALAVLKHSSAMCDGECPEEQGIRKVVELAAVLHDIGIKQAEAKYNSTAPVYQHLEGPPLARKALEKTGVDENTSSRVLYIIGNHHLKSKIDGQDFQILWEADLITNLPDFPVFSGEHEKYQRMVNHNFKTRTGRQIALNLPARPSKTRP